MDYMDAMIAIGVIGICLDRVINQLKRLSPFRGARHVGHVIVKDLCKDFIERHKTRRVLNSGPDTHLGERLEVLDHINLEFQDGELVCVLGPSGCGKSTLANIMAGFEKCSSGTVLIEKGVGPSSTIFSSSSTIVFPDDRRKRKPGSTT
jgi:ABC-type dipeptide/oligopeptide/nickel transport system ATPase subunit